MKRKTLFWAVLLAAAAAVSAGIYLLRPAGGTAANVYVDGELYKTIDLSAVAVPYEETVETDYGVNVLRISPGAIEVIRANCSEQVCVNQGAVTDSLVPIVCLPHHLVIEIEEP